MEDKISDPDNIFRLISKLKFRESEENAKEYMKKIGITFNAIQPLC